MFNRILLAASVAGVVAAMALTAAQTAWVTPLILAAEQYEDAASAQSQIHAHAPEGSGQPEHAWQPENGWQRTLATAFSNAARGVGFALILCGMYALRRPSGVVHGAGWGLAGYLVFFAAPSSGLPPDLPGTAAAALGARQIWWLCTAAATAAGLGLIFFSARHSWRAAGGVLLALPHLIGAPHPETAASLSPAALQNQFRVATIFTSALFWLLLGTLSAAAFGRMSGEPRRQEEG